MYFAILGALEVSRGAEAVPIRPSTKANHARLSVGARESAGHDEHVHDDQDADDGERDR
jgi:hypothetical protein